MCRICMSVPCHPRCPNAPEPVPVLKCDKCGEGIFEGDRYYISAVGNVCENCLDDMTANELLMFENESLETAEKEEW